MKWQPTSGPAKKVQELTDTELLQVYVTLQRVAEMRRRSDLAIYEGVRPKLPHFAERCRVTELQSWRRYVWEEQLFHELEHEVRLRNLPTSEEVKLEEDLEFPLANRGSLERLVNGALLDSINSHGPITRSSTNSAAKRVIGVIKAHNRRLRGDEARRL